MARYGKKRQRNRIIIGTFIFVAVLFIGMAYFFQMQKKAADPGYGKIQEVEVNQNILAEDPEGNVTEGLPMTVKVLDVGDAESVLIDIGQTEVLYDAGYAENGSYVAKGIKSYVDGKLDFLIVSHSHADHCGGVPEVLKQYEVDTIITSGEKAGSSEQFDAAMKSIKNENCTVIADENLTFDLGNDAVLHIIEALDPKDTDSPNDLSVCAYVKYGDDGVLLTGDAENEGEKALKGKLKDYDITAFVAGHHMSSTSNHSALLKEWRPEYIFASTAGPEKSEYGFPHEKALERCLDTTKNVYATYQCGDLILTMDGERGHTLNVDADKAMKSKKENVLSNLFN